jgi:conjugative relaxase-like TrwC/TraI family protein
MASAAAFLSKKASAGAIAWVSREEGQEPNEQALAQVLDREGLPAVWLGTAAADLGLTGEAELADIRELMEKGKVGGKQLGTGEAEKTAVGVILTAPKTVSALLAHKSESVHTHAEAAHKAGADAYVKSLEAALTSRRGRGGKTSVGVTGIAAAAWLHRTSSAGDCHLHSHIFISNIAPGVDCGKWRTLDGNVYLAAKRVAEAAYYHTLKNELKSRLNLSEQDFTQRQVGSVTQFEITSLMEATDKISKARSHIDQIVKKLDKSLGTLSFGESRRAWQEHRKTKAEVAEQIEHELDGDLIAGGDRAEAVRQMWRKDIGATMTALDAITARTEIQKIEEKPISAEVLLAQLAGRHRLAEPAKPPRLTAAEAELAGLRGQLSELRTKREQIDQTLSAAEARFKESHGLPAWKVVKKTQEKWAYDQASQKHGNQAAEIDKNRAEINRKRDELVTEIAGLDKEHDKAMAQHKARLDLEKPYNETLAHLEELSEFTLSDVAALMMPAARGDMATAYRVAGSLMDEWKAAGKIHSAGDNRTAVELMLSKADCDTQDITKSLKTKAVSDVALRAEKDLAQTANELCNVKRRALKIDVTGLSNEQGNASAKMARGRALTIVSGVAGAGKTYLLRPTVDAARSAKIPVIVVSRNTKRAQEVAEELGIAKGFSCAGLQQAMKRDKPGELPKNALIVVDEAGLIDRQHWRDLMTMARAGAQIVAVGDREQSQSIDRRATFAVIEKAAGMADQRAVLTKSYRNEIWEAEADALRNGKAGDVANTVIKERRVWAIADRDIHNKAAELAKEKIDAGKNVCVICITNAEVAEVARKVQHLQGIRGQIGISLDQHAAVGDRVRTRANDHNHGIRNGDEWIVTGATPEALTLKRSRGGKTVEVGRDYFRSSVELAYAVTVDSAQGITIDQAILPLGPNGSDRQKMYSGATRGREAPLYIMACGKMGLPISHGADLLRDSINRDGLHKTAEEIARAAYEAENYSETRPAIEPEQISTALPQGRRRPTHQESVQSAEDYLKKVREMANEPAKKEEKPDKYSELVAAAKADSEAEVEGMSPQQTMRAEMEARHKAAQTPRRGVRMR